MIKSLKLDNYKCFEDGTKLELRPITLLFGYNNAGKSALLRALVLISASLRGRPGSPISLDHESARECSFQDLTGELAFKTKRGFEAEIELDSTIPVSAKWSIGDFPDLKKQVISHFELKSSQARLAALWTPEKQLTRDPLDYFSEPYNLTEYLPSDTGTHQENIAEVLLEFEGLLPEILPANISTSSKMWTDLFARFRSNETNVQWLGPRRTHGERSLVFRGKHRIAIDPDGDGAMDILAAEVEAIGGELGTIGKDVSDWFEKHIGKRLKIGWQSDRYSILLEPLLVDTQAKLQYGVNIADSGEGLMQVLPLLVYISMLKRGSRYDPKILALEEPESHLHPRLHTALAERLLEVPKLQNNAKVVVETHSEIILLRIQRAITEGLDPKSVMVYWVRQLDSGKTQLEGIEFDELGRPNGNLPPLVFAEDSRQARLLLEAQRARSKVEAK